MYQQQQQQKSNNQLHRICRVCLSIVEECMEINTVEHSTGFMPYRDKLALVVPEMMLDMIQDPAICIECSDELQQAYKFKQKCMKTEEEIRRLVQSYGGVIYSLDLSNIADRSKLKQQQKEALVVQPPNLIPKPKTTNIKFPPAVILKVSSHLQKEEKKEEYDVVDDDDDDDDDDEKMKKVVEIVALPKKEEQQQEQQQQQQQQQEDKNVVVVDVEDEIEFHAVEMKNAIEGPLLIPKSEEPVDDPLGSSTPIQPLIPDKRSKLFRVVCNFCGKGFMGMFCLRNHQKVCGKVPDEIKSDNNVETAKTPSSGVAAAAATAAPLPAAVEAKQRRRRHYKPPPYAVAKIKQDKARRITLPLRAKNLLQIWLYHHRDNPYPTDVDKLELVKQTNLTLVQVENWFINARRRILQKMLARGSKYEAKMLQQDCSEEEWA